MKKGGLLFLFCFAAMFSFAQKKVLFEKYTNAFCGTCPDATILIDQIVTENPDVIWISHHKPIGFMNHPLTNEASDAIWDELGINGVPTGMIDRNTYNGDITVSRSLWSAKINEQLQDELNFNIEIANVEYDPYVRELKFEVDVETLAENLAGPFRITAYIIEDSVVRAQSSYWSDTPGHPLEGLGNLIDDYTHRNVVRTILGDHWGTSNVVPENPTFGEVYSHSYEYIVPEEINAGNVHIVTMVSRFDETNNYPGAVENVSRVKLNELEIKLTDTDDLLPLKIAIGPNPASDFLDLEFESIPEQVVVSDLKGIRHLLIKPKFSSMRIDLKDLSSGHYILTSTLNGRKGTQKFSIIR